MSKLSIVVFAVGALVFEIGALTYVHNWRELLLWSGFCLIADGVFMFTASE